MEITTQHSDKVRLYSQDAIRINGLPVQEKIDEAVISLPESQKAVYVGSESNFDRWKGRKWETVSMKSDGPHFFGQDNLAATFKESELDYVYVDASYLNTNEPQEAGNLFDVASKVLKKDGIIQFSVNTLQSGNGSSIADQYNKLGAELAAKGFDISIVLEAPPEQVESGVGKIQMVSIFGRKTS